MPQDTFVPQETLVPHETLVPQDTFCAQALEAFQMVVPPPARTVDPQTALVDHTGDHRQMLDSGRTK